MDTGYARQGQDSVIRRFENCWQTTDTCSIEASEECERQGRPARGAELADWGKGDWKVPLGWHGSPWVAAGNAGRDGFFGKKCMYTPAGCHRATAEPLP